MYVLVSYVSFLFARLFTHIYQAVASALASKQSKVVAAGIIVTYIMCACDACSMIMDESVLLGDWPGGD